MKLAEALAQDVTTDQDIYGPAWIVPLMNIVVDHCFFVQEGALASTYPMYYIANKQFINCRMHNIIIDMDSSIRIMTG